MKNFPKLKCFYVTKDCKFEKNQLFILMTNLSKIKNLWIIEMKFEKGLKLSKKDKDDIFKLFPDISITIKEILWHKGNLNFNK